jgi:hypothetical protein
MGMRRVRLALSAATAALLALGGLAACGSATSTSSLNAGQLPLVPGSRIITQSSQCDQGSNAFCALEAVVVNPQFTSSGALVASEDRLLHQLRWRSSAGDDGDEVARNSPGQKLRLTFATAIDDLIGIDEHWITRSWPIEWTLAHTMMTRTPAMSIMLEQGPT